MENMVTKDGVVILGGGIAGLSAAYFLKTQNIDAVIYEKNDTTGGLCRSFNIEGYDFDYGAHCTFAKDETVRAILEDGVEYAITEKAPYNYCDGLWIKHPVQNNLRVLPSEEKIAILEDFVHKPAYAKADNYHQWLLHAYGKYFTEKYPAAYTRKYWTVEPEQLETKWIGTRMYAPTVSEVLRGAFDKETPNVQYSKGNRYPKSGGYQTFLNNLYRNAFVINGKETVKIDTNEQTVFFKDGTSTKYKYLITTIPLPEIETLFEDLSKKELEAIKKLSYTSLALVSIGLKKLKSDYAATFYIYDEEIYPSRVYSPSLISQNMQNKNTLQAEIYFSKYKELTMPLEKLKEQTINQLCKIGVIELKDIEISDIRYEKYANVIFTPEIYDNRKILQKYLKKKGIKWAGRFTEWDYLWSDQSILSGKKAAEQIVKEMI